MDLMRKIFLKMLMDLMRMTTVSLAPIAAILLNLMAYQRL